MEMRKISVKSSGIGYKSLEENSEAGNFLAPYRASLIVGCNMKTYLALLIYSFGLTGLANAAPLSATQFTQVFSTALKSADPSVTIQAKGDLELVIKDVKEKESTVFLDNAYTQYLRNPKEAKEVLEVYIKSFLELKTKADAIDRTRIVPIIKDRAWLEEIRASVKRQNGEALADNVYEDYNQHLVIVYAEDTPKNISYFSFQEFSKMGIPKDQLRSLAIENLKRLIPKPQTQFGPLVSMITAGGDYEASLILFGDLWAGIPDVAGDIVVAIPSRDLLLFTGSQDRQGVTKLRELAAKFLEESAYHLTDSLFVYRNGKFVPFE